MMPLKGAAVMLSTVHFRNFKVLRNVSISLERMTVLVGANGCGKSSVLQGLDWLLAMTRRHEGEGSLVNGRAGAFFSGNRSLNYLRSKPETDDDVEIEINTTANRIFGIAGMRKHPGSNMDEFSLKLGPPGRLRGVLLPHERSSDVVAGVTELLDSSDFWCELDSQNLPLVARTRLNPDVLSQDHFNQLDVPKIALNGEGLASRLRYLAGLRDGSLEEIERGLTLVVPGARRIRTLPQRMRHVVYEQITVGGETHLVPVTKEILGDRFEVEFEKTGWIPADLLSEGTLIALALLTVLHGPERANLVLLDDIDKGLHPSAQARLLKGIREVLKQYEQLQIVCTSHSPYLIDNFDVKEVRVMDLDEDGYSICKALTEHPELDEWNAVLQAGEFWSSVGGDWVRSGSQNVK
ncbi:MAG: AAA family ATPase [Proteobacteria bacterium]|jgi:predicted ATPase|nr:AAA family ATPase [Pseudomonadota bacterium]